MNNTGHENASFQPSSPPRQPLHDISNHINSLSDTPRRRKTPQVVPPPGPPPVPAPETKWPRFKSKVPMEEIISVTKQIFGYEPKDWQLQTFQKIAEGNNTISIAGTGYGKSLIFALLAIAAQLSNTKGTVIVVCPLKSLEMDQVKRFNMAEGITREDGTEVKISAVAINEDNKDKELFTKLKKGEFRICYASPECLLRNNDFKQLFRRQKFRRRILTLAVDEAHVIEDWKDTFRKDYDELTTLRVIAGTEIPWAALTATCSTETFKVIFESLGMDGTRPFWGIDMGADRPNVAQWVRRMEYSKNSMGDLLAFVPLEAELKTASDLEKTIFYFKTRSQARKAKQKCSKLLAPEFRQYLGLYTATNSEEHKERITDQFKTGQIRWVFATLALGMGLDVPDIEKVVIYGVCSLSEMYQKGGRAGRDPNVRAAMIWLVEGWAFEPAETEEATEGSAGATVSKREADALERCTKMEPAARGYINCSNANRCHREYICSHFRPQPCFPCPTNPSLNDETAMVVEDVQEDVTIDGGGTRRGELDGQVHGNFAAGDDAEANGLARKKQGSIQTWIVQPQVLAKGADCGCSSVTCRANPTEPVGQLDDRARTVIHTHQLTLNPRLATMSQTASAGSVRVSKPEKIILQDTLSSWRDSQWNSLESQYPFFSRRWILSDEDLKLLVDKSSIIVGASLVDVSLLRSLSPSLPGSPAINSLITLLEAFCEQRRQREARHELEHRRKRTNNSRPSTAARQIPSHPTDENDPFASSTQPPQPSAPRYAFAVAAQAPSTGGSNQFSWQI